MRVYVIRHGESETNREKRWTGWLDVPLTQQGRADARKAGEFLKNIRFDRVYASDLGRAVETASIAVPGCKYEVSPLLREINVGSLANTDLSVLTQEQRERIKACGYAEFGGETEQEFYRRIHQFTKELEGQDCETVALFSHAGWLRGMLNMVVGTYLPRERVRCDNCTVAIFEYANGCWRLHSWINLV